MSNNTPRHTRESFSLSTTVSRPSVGRNRVQSRVAGIMEASLGRQVCTTMMRVRIVTWTGPVVAFRPWRTFSREVATCTLGSTRRTTFLERPCSWRNSFVCTKTGPRPCCGGPPSRTRSSPSRVVATRTIRNYMDVRTRPSHSGMFPPASSKPSTPSTTSPTAVRPDYDEAAVSEVEVYREIWWRFAAAAAMVYVFTEYVADITMCEGPSMMPTIQPAGEIILIDKWTVRRRGLQDGPQGAQRIQRAQQRQDQFWQLQQRILHQQHQQQQQQGRPPPSFAGQEFWHEPRLPASAWREYYRVTAPSPGSYGWWRSWRQAWRQMCSPLSVGDVVVVQHPSRLGTVCKRVVGLPGDVVVGWYPTAGHRVAQPGGTGFTRMSSSSSSLEPTSGHQQVGQCQNEPEAVDNTSSDPTSIKGMRPSTGSRSKPPLSGSRQQRQLFVIPDGHVWLEGDNPRNSSDSRHYGPVPAALIVGRVVARLWPLRGQAFFWRGSRPHAARNSPNHLPVVSTGDPRELFRLAEWVMTSTFDDPNVAASPMVLPAGYEGQYMVTHIHQLEGLPPIQP